MKTAATELASDFSRKLSQIPPPGRFSYLCQAALVCETLRITLPELLALFADQNGHLAIKGWDLKYLPDRHWVIFNKRPVPSGPFGTSEASGTSQVVGFRSYPSTPPFETMPRSGAVESMAPDERQDAGETTAAFDPVDVGKRARIYQDDAQRKGLPVPTATEAVEHILSKMGWRRSGYRH